MLSISSADIERWVTDKARESQGYLPLLIRTLIITTVAFNKINEITFPCGDDVVTPGFDGVLVSGERNPFVPLGKSVWEISTRKDTRKKANEDYNSRSKTYQETHTTSYVYVTGRIWRGKKKWEKEKKAENVWNDVTVIDAMDLEIWFQSSPTASLMFLEYLGKINHHVETLENFVKTWLSPMRIDLSPNIAISDRKEAADKLIEYLIQDKLDIRILSNTQDDSVIFVYAVLKSMSDQKLSLSLLSKTLVVSDCHALKCLPVKGITGSVIITNFDQNSYEDILVEGNKRYIYTYDSSISGLNTDITLKRLNKTVISKYLVQAGLPENQADKLARKSDGYLKSLKRIIINQGLPECFVKNTELAKKIIPLVLVQQWSVSHPGDNKVIEALSGTTFSKYEKILMEVLITSECPIRKVGNIWMASSFHESFKFIRPLLSSDDIKILKNVALEVFRDCNPALELDPDKRYVAALYGKKWQYSHELREGIAKTLIYFALIPQESSLDGTPDYQETVDCIVREVFLQADSNLWYSLGDIMPLLAEASPNEFTKAVESSLSSQDKSIMGMFTESENFITSSSMHHQLLWALEALAWDANYFRRSVSALCILTKIDQGGRTLNRPLNSLKSIFRLWMPQTEATSDIRFKVLKEISIEYPDIGWDLLIALLPKSHQVGSYNYRYKWRELSCSADIKVTHAELNESICKSFDIILQLLSTSVIRWAKILDYYANLPKPCKTALMNYFNNSVSELNDTEFLIADKLRNIISKHRSYKSERWAMSEGSIRPLEELHRKLEPTSIISKYKFLFNDYYPALMEGRDSKEENDLHISQLRREAVEEMNDEIGFSGIFEFSKMIKLQGHLADSVPKNTISDNLNLILSKISSEHDGEVFFSQHLLRKGQKEFGELWADAIIKDAIENKWSTRKLTNLLLSFPSERWLWSLVETADFSVQREYWLKTSVPYYEMGLEDTQYAVNKLLDSRRNFSAIDLAHHAKSKLPISDIVLILEMMDTTECSEPTDSIVSYYVEELIERVQSSHNVDLQAKMKLEWMYISVLTSLDSRIGPKSLHEEMSKNPNAFVDVLSMVYKPQHDSALNNDEGQDEQIDALGERVAESAFNLLNSWQLIPGKTSEGTIDVSILRKWIDDVIKLSEQRGFTEVALCSIGTALSYSEGEADGQWPCNSVCEILEHYNDDRINLNFRIGIRNQRGATVRGLFDGGAQERVLVDKYKGYAYIVMANYPRVSIVLNDIAKDYECDARREDERAEKNRIKYE